MNPKACCPFLVFVLGPGASQRSECGEWDLAPCAGLWAGHILGEMGRGPLMLLSCKGWGPGSSWALCPSESSRRDLCPSWWPRASCCSTFFLKPEAPGHSPGPSSGQSQVRGASCQGLPVLALRNRPGFLCPCRKLSPPLFPQGWMCFRVLPWKPQGTSCSSSCPHLCLL